MEAPWKRPGNALPHSLIPLCKGNERMRDTRIYGPEDLTELRQLARPSTGFPTAHSRFLGFRRLTRDSWNRRLTRFFRGKNNVEDVL